MDSPEELLRIYTIYERPRDLPGCYVVRGHTVIRGGGTRPDPGAMAFEIGNAPEVALERARMHCRSLGLSPLARHEQDDPAIVECWL